MPLLRAAPESRAGDGVARDGLVDADEDTWVGGLVEGSGSCARRDGAAGASNGEVDALRVVLRAVGIAGGVETNNLVAKDVVAWCNGRWDLDGPGDVVGC